MKHLLELPELFFVFFLLIIIAAGAVVITIDEIKKKNTQKKLKEIFKGKVFYFDCSPEFSENLEEYALFKSEITSRICHYGGMVQEKREEDVLKIYSENIEGGYSLQIINNDERVLSCVSMVKKRLPSFNDVIVEIGYDLMAHS